MNQQSRPSAKTLGRIPGLIWSALYKGGMGVVLLVLPAVLPLAGAGFFESHDGLHHTYRLAALDQAVRAGVLYPRWFPEFAFGYGHPVLNFYGPLGYYFGLPFTLLGLSPFVAMKLVFAGGLIASALGMFLFVRLHLDRGPAIVAAVVYAYLPYHLADLYVRGALAEFLAFAWFPLVLWAFHRLVEGPDRIRLSRLALAVLLLSALIVTHNLSAFVFAPVLLVYVVLVLWARRDRHVMMRGVLALSAALVLTLTLTAVYWLPVLAESRYVGLASTTSQGYREHLVSLTKLISLSPAYPYMSGPGVVPVYPLGLLQVVILAAALALPLVVRSLRRPAGNPKLWVMLFFLLLGFGSAFMLTTYSLPAWQVLEKALAFLQYPWRLQALTALATAFLAGGLVHALPSSPRYVRAALAVPLIAATVTWALWRLPVTPVTPDLGVEEMWQREYDVGQVGTTWTGEFLPIWVTEQRWAIAHPSAEPAATDEQLTAGQLRLTGVAYTGYELALAAPQKTSVVLHQFYYPGWQARWQGVSYVAQPKSPLGLAAFELPAGSGPLSLRLALTRAQLWGTLLSLTAALVMGFTLVARGRAAREAGAALSLATVCLLVAAGLLVSVVRPNGTPRAVQPANANLEDTVELLASAFDRTQVRPGEGVDVTLYWVALRSLSLDYKAFVHLTDAALTRQAAQHDGDPGGGFTPTNRWLPGEILPDRHRLSLPADLPPGRYVLWAGMYEYPAVRNLEVLSAAVPNADNRVLIGEIEVVAP